MVSEKEALLLKYLRGNSRISLAKISKETNIPLSTLCDSLKRLESNAIKKHVSLTNFSNIGYNIKVNFAISTGQKQKLKEFLLKHPNINSLSSLINGHDFFAECIFRDLKEVNEFKESLEKFNITKIEDTFIIDELKKEGFSL